jgi:DNA modification methylase
MEILPTLPSVAVVLTDPPYGIDYQSGHATDELWAGGRKIANDNDVTTRDAFIANWLATQATPILAFGSRRKPEPQGCRMVLVWDKGAALGMGALDLPWKPSSEEIYVIGKGFKGERDESNVLYCPPVQSMAKNGRQHPNQKPVDLLKRLLLKSPKGAVFDPFMGSGSTGVAAVQLGRPFIGVELMPAYYDIACERIRKAYAQPDMFIECPAPAKQLSMLGGEG